MSESKSNEVYKAPTANVARDEEAEFDITTPLLSPKGRIGRVRYFGYSILLAFVFTALLGFAMSMVGDLAAVEEDGGLNTSLIIVMVVIYPMWLVPAFILMIKRFHDINLSGWFSLASIIPLVNLIMALALLLVGGTKGPNKYGLKPTPSSTVAVFAVVLIAVVVIGGILAAVAVPAYNDYIQMAEQAQQSQSNEGN